jgi:hypothetical protein
MSSGFAGINPRYVPGTGPAGRVEVADLRSKLGEIQGEVEETAETAKPYLTYAAVAGVVVVVVLAFVLGRSRGQRRATWVEIRRM